MIRDLTLIKKFNLFVFNSFCYIQVYFHLKYANTLKVSNSICMYGSDNEIIFCVFKTSFEKLGGGMEIVFYEYSGLSVFYE